MSWMSWVNLWIVLLGYIYIFLGGSAASIQEKGQTRSENCLSATKIRSPSKSHRHLDVYCFHGEKPSLIYLWKTVEVYINTSAEGSNIDEYQIYRNENKTLLIEEHAQATRWFGVFRRYKLWHSSYLNPFKSTYVGIDSLQEYTVWLNIRTVDFRLVTVFFTGIVLFFTAKTLCRNAAFYYAGGIGVGLLGSVLLVAFIAYRFIPKRSAALTFLIGGWSLGLWVLYSVWQHMRELVIEHQRWIAVYLISVSVISFAVLYKLGPPTDIRSLNLVQWTLQLFACCCIYAGCQLDEVRAATILSCFLVYFVTVPGWLVKLFQRFRRRLFPIKPKLLTEEEYIQQGAIETEKALEQLRSFCRSPECSPWRVVNHLRDPLRFARFVEGSSHLTDDELLLHDSLSDDELLEQNGTDDESPVDTDDSAGITAISRKRIVQPSMSTSFLSPSAHSSRNGSVAASPLSRATLLGSSHRKSRVLLH